jgi:SAM-dependent methyltransferase
VDPRPTPAALAARYETDSYAHAERHPVRLFDRDDPRARAWYAVRRGALRRAGYRHLADDVPALASAVARLPWVHRRATFSLGVLLHPWQPDAALLEVGCGSGGYLDLMRALGWRRVVGVDISEAAIGQARETLALEAHRGDVRDLHLEAASFDAVSMSHTLEHVDDPVAVLTEVRRVTRPRGRVAIVVPNIESLQARLLRGAWAGLDAPRHLVNFTPTGLRSAIEGAGLSVEHLSTSAANAYPFALWSLRRARGRGHPEAVLGHSQYGVGERALAHGLASVERTVQLAGLPVGEEICAVARV